MQQDYQKKYQLSLNVASTLGGLTLAALTFLMSNNTTLSPHYKLIVISGLGIVSTLFIVSVIGLKGILVNQKYKDKIYDKITFGFYEAGLAGLVILFPIFVMAFNFSVGLFILIIVAFWGLLAMFNRFRYLTGFKIGRWTIKKPKDEYYY